MSVCVCVCVYVCVSVSMCVCVCACACVQCRLVDNIHLSTCFTMIISSISKRTVILQENYPERHLGFFIVVDFGGSDSDLFAFRIDDKKIICFFIVLHPR